MIMMCTAMCMIKIFRGWAGVVTPSKPPPPYKQLLPLPTPYFKMFLERSLNDPPPPHFKHLSLLPPSPSTTPPPPKNFDHTPFCQQQYKRGSCYISLFSFQFLCYNSNHLISLIPPPRSASNFRYLVSCGIIE